MQLTYKFHCPFNQKLYEYCIISKNLYNQALFIVNKALENNKYIYYEDLDKIMKTLVNLDGNINYRLLKSHCSQQILILLGKDLKSFYKGLDSYRKDPSKFKNKPKQPSYKKEVNLLIYTNQISKIKNNEIILAKNFKIKLPQYKQEFESFNQIRILPVLKHNRFEIEIIYTVKEKPIDIVNYKYIGIDLGINNLMSCISEEFCQIYSGRQLKSINQWYNKEKSRLYSCKDKMKQKYSIKLRKLDDKRNKKIKDLLHKASTHLINQCINKGINTIVVGYNKSWKDSIKLGNKTNQTFVQLPHCLLLNMLKYKAKINGILYIETEESYTSKCDSLALEKLGFNTNYLGFRIKRGLFQSSVKRLLNADINGALNILRKVVNDSPDIQKIIDSGLLFRPIKINDLFNLSYKQELNEELVLINETVEFINYF